MRKAWDDMTHADHFCDEASFGSGTVGNVIIFSHGSGSLVVANALNNNRCQFSGSTRWYSAMVRRGHWRDSWAVPVCGLVPPFFAYRCNAKLCAALPPPPRLRGGVLPRPTRRWRKCARTTTRCRTFCASWTSARAPTTTGCTTASPPSCVGRVRSLAKPPALGVCCAVRRVAYLPHTHRVCASHAA